MHRSLLVRVVCLAALVGLFAAPLTATPLPDGEDPIAAVTASEGQIVWQPLRTFDRLYLVIATPDGKEISRAYLPGEVPSLSALGTDLGLLADGDYTYTLILIEPGTEVEGETIPAITQRGPFTISGFDVLRPEGVMDQVIPDDLIVQMSLCVGTDCVNNESFGFDTIRLKENNLRINFDDTSTLAGFPANDWRIVANDSPSGGANYLAFEDATAGNLPFRVDAGAGANALRVASNGNVGFGTGSPALDAHIRSNNTPAIRYEQDGSGGWSPQTWDVAGNEANFFIRDVTGGGRLVFRIKPGAPANSIFVQNDGNVGLGTSSPTTRLHVLGDGYFEGGGLFATEYLNVTGDMTGNPFAVKIKDTGSNTLLMKMDLVGNMTIGGTLSQGSSESIKSHFQAVDNQAILDRLVAMPLWTWQYRTDEHGVRHLGPTSQDFMAAFSLGEDEEHIAAVDADGVTMAAIQALNTQLQVRDARIQALTEQNQALEARLARIEALLLQNDASTD